MEHLFKVKFGTNGKGRKQTDIRSLGKSLASLADAIERANAINMGPVSDLSFNIKRYEIGSDVFDIAITAANAVGPLVPIALDVVSILEHIGLVEHDGISLLELFGWKQSNPDYEVTKEENGKVTISAGDMNKIEVNTYVFNMASSPELTKALKDAFEIPLRKGVEAISVSSGGLKGVEQTQETLPNIAPFAPLSKEPVTNIVKKWLVVTRPNLDKGTDFFFKDGDTNKEKRIQINDDLFVKEVLSGKDFRHGDMLWVDLKEEQYFDTVGRLQTKLSIEKVYTHKSADEQLLFTY